MKLESKKDVIGVALARLVRGAWWLAWVPLFILAALYVGFHIPGALLILALNDDCAASRWLHDSTDWALDGIWKICPANAGGDTRLDQAGNQEGSSSPSYPPHC
jgi:hypothetical protein